MCCADGFCCDKVIFCGILPGFCDFKYFYYLPRYWRVYRSTCPHLDRRGVVVAMLWRVLIGMPSAHAVRTKARGKTHAWRRKQTECKFCIVLTPEQRAQLATPSYKLKKEKREKKLESSPSKDSTLEDPSTVAVIGAVSNTGTLSSPPSPYCRSREEG